jgi:hypothetical protein
VPAGKLVYFHSHSQEGWPIVLLPRANQHNRWSFHERGYLVQDGGWVETMEALKPEGFYRLREHVHLGSEQVVGKDALVQLGYDREAAPIMFFPRRHETDNALVFPERGTKLSPEIYKLLEPLDVRGPHVPGVRHLH